MNIGKTKPKKCNMRIQELRKERRKRNGKIQ